MIPSLQQIKDTMYKIYKKESDDIEKRRIQFANECAETAAAYIRSKIYTEVAKNAIRIGIQTKLEDKVSLFDIRHSVADKLVIHKKDITVDVSGSWIYIIIKLFEI